MNNKFKIKNLENEKRRIDNQIKRLKKYTTMMEGDFLLSSIVIPKKSESPDLLGKKITYNIPAKILFERYQNEIVCTLTIEDERFKHGKTVFKGKAKWNATNDKEYRYRPELGMALAQNRATTKVYEYLTKILSN